MPMDMKVPVLFKVELLCRFAKGEVSRYTEETNIDVIAQGTIFDEEL
jgi:hypothetical protein